MNVDLQGHVAIVTGAARGIGHDIAIALAGEGVTVAALDVSDEALDTIRRELGQRGQQHRCYAVDVRDAAGIARTVEDIVTRCGRIDLLVNNAGVVGNGLVSEVTEEIWDLVHDVNLKGTFLMCRAVIPTMQAQGRGRIINAASYAAITPRVGSIPYASSKAAVAHFSRGLAGELGPWNITVNAYAPGMIPTQMNHFAELPEADQNELLGTLTLREWGSTEDISNLICFLASDKARYITGTLIDVSGGKLATQIPAEAYERVKGTRG